MSLAALIGAYHESSDPGDGLRATLPLAGRTLVERQARFAANAGAATIIIVVDRQPPALDAAIRRLQAEGLDILVARSAAEAAKAVQPGDRILLIADGLLADEALAQRLVEQENVALLTVLDVRFDDRFERIDAEFRWGGLALIDGQLLKHTAAMLQDWDLQSTLLRRAVQGGARQLAAGTDPAGPQPVVAERTEDLAALEAHILDHASRSQSDWVSRYLLAPLEHAATRRLMPSPVSPDQLWLAGLALTALSAFAFSRGWLWTGLGLFLAATPLAGIAERLARLRVHGVRGANWLSHLGPIVSATALLALGYALIPAQGWGSLTLGATAIAFVAALTVEKRALSVAPSALLAEAKGMAWLLLPFAATGIWAWGLVALALYAAGSFFLVQRQAHTTRLTTA